MRECSSARGVRSRAEARLLAARARMQCQRVARRWLRQNNLFRYDSRHVFSI